MCIPVYSPLELGGGVLSSSRWVCPCHAFTLSCHVKLQNPHVQLVIVCSTITRGTSGTSYSVVERTVVQKIEKRVEGLVVGAGVEGLVGARVEAGVKAVE